MRAPHRPGAEPPPRRWNRQRFDPISAAEREAEADQLSLFEVNPDLPDGFRYRPDVLDEDEERALVAEIARLPFKAFEFHGFSGKRRVVSFGWRYDFNEAKLREADPVPKIFHPVRAKAAGFAGLDAGGRTAPGDGIPAWRRERLAQGPGDIRGAARNDCEHSIPGVEQLRYSLTFRNFRPASMG